VASIRRLAAIMFTDIAGFTASAQADEARTLELLKEEEELVRPLLLAHQGREIKSTGDGSMVEFDSALRAVQCAIDIHQHLHERNSQPGVTPIRLRIGIHLGDVEERANDIFGDAVNIASRIEPLASPGGLCISGQVFDQVRNKIPNKLEKLEPRDLKGVHTSIDLYRVVLPWTGRESAAVASGPTRLAVLPFTNMSPDPSDLFFADGLTEELITVLSQLRELRVIARTSIMQYKSTTKTISQIGADLDVSSILEGSVRRAGNRLRITAQLIDVDSQEHVWAKSYDRQLDDVFVIQTEIAKQVAESLKLELRPAEESRLESRPVVRPDSYLAYLKGLTLMRVSSELSIREARAQFELAVSLDDRNAAAHAGLSMATYTIGIWYTDASNRGWMEGSRRSAARALELEPNLAEAHEAMGTILWDELDHSAAEKEFKRALALNPSFSRAHSDYAILLMELDRSAEALVEFSLAEGADPFWSFPIFHHANLLSWLGGFDEARELIGRIRELAPDEPGYHSALAVLHLEQGDIQRCMEEILRAEEKQESARFRPILRAWHLMLSGDKEGAKALLSRDPTLPDFGQNAHSMAVIYAELGDLDECFRLLNRALATDNLPVFPWRLDPRLKRVRDDPRFLVLLKKMNLA
jgi:adenylate cyclase